MVRPLFDSPGVLGAERFQVDDSQVPFQVGVDEDRLLSWTLGRDGSLELHSLESGARIDLRQPFEGSTLTSASFSLGGEDAVFGFADGTARGAKVAFRTAFREEADIPEDLRGIAYGASTIFDGGILDRTAIGQLRHTTLDFELEEPLETGDDSAVVRIDHVVTPSGLSLVTLQESGALRVSRERRKRNLLTGKVTKSLRHAELVSSTGEGSEDQPATPMAPGDVLAVRIGGLGQHVYVIGRDGATHHWDLRSFSEPRLYEELDLLADPEGQLTAVEFVTGRQTLVVGDSWGRLTTWFPARIGDPDGEPLLRKVAEFESGDAEVLAIAAAPRSRLIAASFGSGRIALYQSTLASRLLGIDGDEPLRSLTIPPKGDALIGRGAGKVVSWEIDPKHPEANLTALFTPLWYEGYEGPSHVWQSSSASDDFEPKLGLIPLIFGTLKATLYSLLFGAPLAILAAIYTSEFLSPKLRSSIKSTVELMASLPSVVLGFIGALVIAPFVQEVLPAVMAAFLTVPLTLLAGAYLWQLLPPHLALRWAGWQRFLAIGLSLPIGVFTAIGVGPLLERLVFSGDVTAWLGGQQGVAWGGWFFLLLPLAGLAMAFVGALVFSPWLRERSVDWDRSQLARVDGLSFLGAILATMAVAAATAFALQSLGLDPRGGVVATYVQRNALIVGFVMGFAIVPIIYTLAEDALSEVPVALREGSLGAGATRWQTAVRIVIPFAMSGIFSALMIGLGRAVGETMIVLMAAGNTPIMEWNIFNGFRTLSANIAVELPEAVEGSAHYRTLFLAALVLFGLTFVLNTLAELVRRHFRSRFKAL